MSKRTVQTDWQPEIDQSYERQVGRLGAIEGSVNDYVSKPTREQAARPEAWVPEVRPQQPPVTVRRMVEPISIAMPQQSVMSVDVRTSARDRAEAFNIETHRLSIAVGLLAVLVAAVGFGHPVLTVGTLFTFGIWYSLVWLGAWLFHRIVSPEGLAFFNAVMMWRYINRR